MSIKRQFFAGSIWTILGTSVNNAASFVVFVALTRLIDPVSIGLVTFALIFIDFGRPIVFGGLPEAMVQRKEWDHEVASTCFTANLVMALMCSVVMSLAIAPFAMASHQNASLVMAALTAIFIVDGARAIHEAKLRREFAYRSLAARSSIATIISGVIGVAMAYMGYGVWALVTQRLFASVTTTLMTWHAAKWMPRFTLSIPALKSVSHFAFHLAPARILTLLNLRIPEFCIGIFLGPAGVAFYRVGLRGLEIVSQLFVAPVQTASLSAFSRLSSKEEIGAAYVRVTKLAAFVACPVNIGIGMLASDFILTIFGPKWAQSGWVLTFLGLGVGSATISYFLQPALTAAGQTRIVLRSSMLSFVSIAASALLSVKFGLIAVAAANLIRGYLAAPFLVLLLRSGLHIKARDLILAVLPAFLAASVMGATIWALRSYMLMDLPAILRMAICAAVGAPLYFVLLFLFAGDYLRSVSGELRPLLPKQLSRFMLAPR